MKKFYKKGIGVALAVTMASSGVVAYAAEATKDGSGAAGVATEATKDGSGAAGVSEGEAPENKEVDGSQFAGEEWYDQRATFQVNREDAHTSFVSFGNVEDARVRDKEKSPSYQLLN